MTGSKSTMQPRAEGSGVDSALADVKTLVVDDHGAFREALRELITAVPGFSLVGLAASGEEAVRAVARLAPQMVLMDVVMPGMDGIAAARIILRMDPQVFVVLISVDDPALYAAADEFGGAIACARKQDLGPRKLRQVWETHQN